MKIFAYFFIVLVAGAVAFGLWSIGGPGTARDIRLDSQRISDLQNLQYQIIYYWQAKQKLPVNLSDIVDATRGVSLPVDPETRGNYEYRTTDALTFELCATFSLDQKVGGLAYSVPVAPEIGIKNGGWDHSSGRVCFQREIDPAFYKPIK